MPAVQYPNLSEMFYEGPGISKYYEGSRRADEASANNAQNLAEAQAQAYRDQQLHPLALQEKQQLIKQRQLGNELAEAKQPSELKKVQYGAEEADYKAQQQFGQALEQWGSIAEANGGQIPLQLQKRMPPELAQLFAQPNGWQQAKQAGTAMREASMKWLQQQSKQGSAEEISDDKLKVARELEAGRNARAAAANALKSKLSAAHTALLQDKAKAQDPKTWQALATKYTLAANNPSLSNEERSVLADQAERAAQMQAYIASIAATAKLEGTPDVGKITNLPTVAPKPMPKPTAPASGFKKDDKGRIVLD